MYAQWGGEDVIGFTVDSKCQYYDQNGWRNVEIGKNEQGYPVSISGPDGSTLTLREEYHH
jgi:hypothetical protein